MPSRPRPRARRPEGPAADLESDLLTLEEVDELNEAEAEAEPVAYSGIDYDVEGLVRRLGRAEIVVPTFGHGDESLQVAGFQRGFVWRKPQMDRFIESLLLGYPIPGIMLVQQADKRYLVLDGQQRLRTLQAFYSGVYNDSLFALDNVAEEFKGLTYETLDAEQRRTVDNTFIQATIVKTDGSRESLDNIYQVFERLNSGGTQLTAHEIRIALYAGKMIDFLAELNQNPAWREIYGPESPRLRDHELILRILTLYFKEDEYSRPLKKFLSDFVGDNRDLKGFPKKRTQGLFERSAELLADAGARDLVRPSGRLNAALLEAVFVGIMRAIAGGRSVTPAKVERTLGALATDTRLLQSVSGSTATEENVRVRLDVATRAFRRR